MTLPTPELNVELKIAFGGHRNHGIRAKASIQYHGFDVQARVNDGPWAEAWQSRDMVKTTVNFPEPLKADDVMEVRARVLRLGGKDQQEIVESSEWSAPQRFVYGGSHRFTGGTLKPQGD